MFWSKLFAPRWNLSLTGIISILLLAWIYIFRIPWLGFPDGYLTEFEAFEKATLYVFSILFLLNGGYSIFTGMRTMEMNSAKKAVISFSFLALTLGLLVLFYLVGPLFFDTGGGG